MSHRAFSVRMDSTLKNEFEILCSDFGMNMSTAINVSAKAVVRERRIPFEIVSPDNTSSREKVMKAFLSLREEAARNFPNGMSLDEIDSEISKARNAEADS